MKSLLKTAASLIILSILFIACTKNESSEFDNNPDIMGYMKFGAESSQNSYGLICSISTDSVLVTSGEDFTINYTIENNSSNDFSKPVYILVNMVYNQPDYPLGQYFGDYYSMLWWHRTSWGRETKVFELGKNSSYSQSINVSGLGWISAISSAIQPDNGNFYELFATGNFKFQLSVMVDDSNDNDTSTVPTVIYSNLLDLTID